MMSDKEKIWILIDYIINTLDCCPFEDEWENNLEKDCVGLGEVGCGDCIIRNLDKLRC